MRFEVICLEMHLRDFFEMFFSKAEDGLFSIGGFSTQFSC